MRAPRLLMLDVVYLRYYDLYLMRKVKTAVEDAVKTFDDAVKPPGTFVLLFSSLHVIINPSGRGIQSDSTSLGAKQY